jgi:acetyl-CoA carboxylase carboxyl transferase subunit alpha
MKDPREFERPLLELESRIESLTLFGEGKDRAKEIASLKKKLDKMRREVFSDLTPWQVVQVARHPHRPYTLDYIPALFTDFMELHGDRHFADDPAIVAGTARFHDRPVCVIGHQKGRDTKQKIYRNFGMPRPEGYRKALRLMEMAERFKMPVITLIDTPGAYPGIDSEERGISEAIAQNLAVMSRLATPILCVVIGEGSSGGALGIGVGDHLAMLQYSTYFVISPEGCANIIWKSTEHAADAAEAMGVTSGVLQELGIVDATIEEPLGGAHRNVDQMAERIGQHLVTELGRLEALPLEQLLEQRYQRLMSYGN